MKHNTFSLYAILCVIVSLIIFTLAWNFNGVFACTALNTFEETVNSFCAKGTNIIGIIGFAALPLLSLFFGVISMIKTRKSKEKGDILAAISVLYPLALFVTAAIKASVESS